MSNDIQTSDEFFNESDKAYLSDKAKLFYNIDEGKTQGVVCGPIVDHDITTYPEIYKLCMFVKEIVEGKQIAVIENVAIDDYSWRIIANDNARILINHIAVINQYNVYSNLANAYINPYIKLFINHFFGIPYRVMGVQKPSYNYTQAQIYAHVAQQLNKMIEHGKSVEFKQEIDSFKQYYQFNINRVNKHIDALFDKYDDLLMVRLDLFYDANQPCLDSEKVVGDRKRLIEHIKKTYKSYVTYIAKLEYTAQKGYYYHIAVFFNNNVTKDDFDLGNSLGKVWKEKAHNKGRYFNCSTSKTMARSLPCGILNTKDAVARQSMQQFVDWIARVDFYVNRLETVHTLSRYNLGSTPKD